MANDQSSGEVTQSEAGSRLTSCAMVRTRLSPPARTFIAATALVVLLAVLFLLRPRWGGVEFLLGFIGLTGLAAVLPVCAMILLGRPPQSGTISKSESRWIYAVAVAGLVLAAVVLWLIRHGVDHVITSILAIVLFIVLLTDIPLCVLAGVGYPVALTLAPLVPSAAERAKWREMRSRPALSDDEFIERYYADASISRDIPLRLRHMYAGQLGIDRVQPADVAAEFDSELDMGDLVVEVEHQFGVEFKPAETAQLAGSFDAIVRAVAAKLRDPARKQDNS